MPTYNYKCLGCGKHFVVFKTMNEEHTSNCKLCHSDNVKRIISGGAGLIFKGSGFYLTDYKNNSKKEGKNNIKEQNKE